VETVRLLEPAARALGVAHELGVAHRDVKPANLFVLGDPRGPLAKLKVLDFGIAKVVHEARKAGAFTRTGGGITSFTPAYGAPEQFSRKIGPTGPWTDVYALALVVIEVFTNIEVLTGEEDLVEYMRVSCDPLRRPTPRALGVAVDDHVEQVFERALAVDPRKRYPEAGQFWNDLLRVLDIAPLTSSAFTSTPSGVVVPRVESSVVTLLEPPSEPRGLPQFAIASPPLPRPRDRRRVTRVGAAFTGVAVMAALGYAMLISPKTAAPVQTVAAKPVAPASSTPLVTAPAAHCPVDMVLIPGGKFYMGSDEGLPNERPAHKVVLAQFCIDVHEVTTEAYKACSDAGDCKRAPVANAYEAITDKERRAFDPLCNGNQPVERAKHPINCVDWDMAQVFCSARGGRLPSEAEWEFSARGPDGRKYPWGDEAPSGKFLNACGSECLAWGQKNHVTLTAMYNTDDGWETTAPVGSFPAGNSRYGLEDVVGNVWEWVNDWYEPYGADAATQPTGPNEGSFRVVRGGAWNGGYDAWVRPTFRYRDAPEARSHGIGFRCAMTL
jgi:eukaryotic-like serine/threonine-protein kinase